MIKAFPMSKTEIEEWTNTIMRLRPKVDGEIIGTVIDKFLTGEWDFDKDIGIQNIFKGIDYLNSPTPPNYQSS